MTFLAALRSDRIEAPCLIDGPINGERFRLYVETMLAPTLRAGDIVIMDNLGSHRGKVVRKPSEDRRKIVLPTEILPRPEPDRAGVRQAQVLAA